MLYICMTSMQYSSTIQTHDKKLTTPDDHIKEGLYYVLQQWKL